ncbi:hypothetical protein MPSEU_000398400 [Mayamaea pseudoterrestris]|nr:hypothetical protein MPSEU_000398400 [Mayamaea pseudoterrestris]
MMRLRFAVYHVFVATSGILFLHRACPADAFVSNLSTSVHQQRALFVPTHQEAIDSVTWAKYYSAGEYNSHHHKDKRIIIRNYHQQHQQQPVQHYHPKTTLLNRLPTAFSRRFFFVKAESSFTKTNAAAASALVASTTTVAAPVIPPPTWGLLLAACLFVNVVRWPSAISLLQQALAWYIVQLEASPLLTKSLTSGIIGLAGDCLAQSIDRFVKRRKAKANNSGTAASADLKYDQRRGLSVLLEGLLISGPTMHVGYDLFERILPTSSASGHSSVAAMLHVLADSILLDSFFIGTAFVITGLIEGYRIKQIRQQLKTDYAPTLIASWITSTSLMPIEFLAFRFLPVSLRVLAVKFIDVIWDTVISFMTHRGRSHGDGVNGEAVTVSTFPALPLVEEQQQAPELVLAM